MRFVFASFLLFFLYSCQNKENEAKIKEMELQLKAKELELEQTNIEYKQRAYQDSITNVLEKENSQIKSLVELYDENKESVFFIVTADNSNFISTGSGFFVREDGLAVSNFHVFEDAEQAIIETHNGKRYMVSQIVDYDSELDYIVFKINTVHNEVFQPVVIATQEPKIGEDCFAIGNPKQFKSTLSKGIISGFRDYLIQTTAQITFGSSGGALFNSKGEVIGITTSGIGEADLNFALNIIDTDFKNLVLDNYIDSSVASNNSHNDSYNGQVNNYEAKEIINTLMIYYKYLEDKNYEKQFDMYAPVLYRCYNKMNLSRNEVIKEQKSYNKTYPYQKTTIDRNTINITKDMDGNFNLNFQGEFFISKESWNNPKKFDIDMFIVFDNKYKIRAIYSNIIK